MPEKGTYIFEFFREIDENKRHILYLERHIDETKLSDEEALLNGNSKTYEKFVRKFDDYVKFELGYQVKKNVADLVFWEEGHLEEGIEDRIKARMYKLVGEEVFAEDLIKQPLIQ